MRWSHVQEDWTGFVTLVDQILPVAGLRNCAPFPADQEGFSTALAQATDLTFAEVSDLLVTRILPIWHIQRMAQAA